MLRESVHMVWDMFDIPRKGIADFKRKAHIFDCQFDYESDEWTDLFCLMPISQEHFSLELERNQIFLRWRDTVRVGVDYLKDFPALPADRPRYEELKAMIGDRSVVRPEVSFFSRGRFGRSWVEWEDPGV